MKVLLQNEGDVNYLARNFAKTPFSDVTKFLGRVANGTETNRLNLCLGLRKL